METTARCLAESGLADSVLDLREVPSDDHINPALPIRRNILNIP